MTNEATRSQIISEVIVGELMMDPSRFLIEVDDGVVLLQGKAERSSLIPTWSVPFITWKAWSGSRTSSASTWTTTTRRSPTPGCGPERAGNEAHGAFCSWSCEHRPCVSLTVERMGDHTCGMEKFSLEARARVLMNSAATAPAGRAAETVYGGHEHVLRQTLIALTAGSVLSEHENPGEATVQVLGGRVRLVADTAEWEGRDGDLLIVPKARHRLHAVEDSAVLLTVAKLP
jgi:quercetin dioxygenase-like cupin family protein